VSNASSEKRQENFFSTARKIKARSLLAIGCEMAMLRQLLVVTSIANTRFPSINSAAISIGNCRFMNSN